MIKKIASAIILGLIMSVMLLQRDHAIARAVGAYCTQLFHDYLDCNFDMKVKNINLFTGTIIFEHVTASDSKSNDWAWRSRELIILFSLWELVPHGKIIAHMQFNDFQGNTTIKNGTFGIVPHIIKAMCGFSSTIPLVLRTMSFCHANLQGNDAQNKIDAFVHGDGNFRFGDQSCEAVFNFIDGAVAIKNREMASMLDGQINLDIPYYHKNWFVGADLRCHAPQLKQQGVNCFCQGAIRAGIGSFAVKSIDDSLTINPISLDLQSKAIISTTINAPLNLLYALMMQQEPDDKIGGHATLSIAYNHYEQPYVAGNITCSDVSYKNIKCASRAAVAFAQDDGGWRGKIDYNYSDTFGFHGDWRWAQGKGGLLQLSNNVPLCNSLSDPWEIACDKLSLSCSIDSHYKINGAYKGLAANKKTNEQIPIAGTLAIDKQEAAIGGTFGNQNYNAVVWLSPVLGLKEFKWGDPQSSHIHLQGKEFDHRLFAGSIQLASCADIIENVTGYKLDGEGKIDLYGIVDYPRLSLKTKFSQGAIRLPHLYNCINKFEVTGSIDTERNIKLRSLDCDLYEGSFHCKNAYVQCDENWQPTFMYVPLIADHCLINEKKNIFSSISGNILLSKNDASIPCISGNLILNRSHLSDSIFSGALSELCCQYSPAIMPSRWADMQCDLQIETEHPIHVKTTFLDTQAKAIIKLKGRMQAPEVSGNIVLDGGTLLFPYKSLVITKGLVTINEQQLNDPFIELVAKNIIKKYLISLNVQGSLNHHEIIFSSNPPLKDQQIIGLLFAGSEEESLKSIAPALVMSNIKQLLFSSDPNSIAHRFLDPTFQPLSNVHFIPSFNDQLGRGGMRGTFEIDINDRWRAMIQKNFNLSEDTHVELEYLLSDEISIKGIRDEHRDISGEVEMRLKF